MRLHSLLASGVVAASLFLLWGCGEAEKATYDKVGFNSLPGWQDQRQLELFRTTMLRSCTLLSKRNAEEQVDSDHPEFGTYGHWQTLCTELQAQEGGDVRAFLEQRLVPYKIIKKEGRGLFTGYYAPVIDGRFEQVGEYQYPIYRRPNDLIQVNLGQFDPKYEGQTLMGRVVGNRLQPYYTRKEIDMNRSLPSSDVLLWLKDPVDVFFLHVQGSGRVRLPSGRELNIGYAGNNGHPYTSIGAYMARQGLLPLEEVSLFSLRQWLDEHPDQRDEVLAQNARYIFFRFTDNGAVGAQGVELTAERSLAVDPAFVPLGLPVYVDTVLSSDQSLWQRLMVAQDTGKAIVGPARGDIFFGHGEEAELKAGVQNADGDMYILAPRSAQ